MTSDLNTAFGHRPIYICGEAATFPAEPVAPVEPVEPVEPFAPATLPTKKAR